MAPGVDPVCGAWLGSRVWRLAWVPCVAPGVDLVCGAWRYVLPGIHRHRHTLFMKEFRSTGYTQAWTYFIYERVPFYRVYTGVDILYL